MKIFLMAPVLLMSYTWAFVCTYFKEGFDRGHTINELLCINMVKLMAKKYVEGIKELNKQLDNFK